jgi:hypothetical protein
MIERFLRAKHWQVFLVICGFPYLFQLILMPTMMAGNSFVSSLNLLLIITIVCAFVLFAWLWSIAIGLQSKIPVEVKMNVRKFKMLLLFTLVYLLFFSIYMASLFNSIGLVRINSVETMFGMFWIILPLHFFCMFCMLYCLYFVAKTFKSVELQREVVFSDFAVEFFLFWFFPIGIWIVQPKINKMIQDKEWF